MIMPTMVMVCGNGKNDGGQSHNRCPPQNGRLCGDDFLEFSEMVRHFLTPRALMVNTFGTMGYGVDFSFILPQPL